jgi:hypothetical protein
MEKRQWIAVGKVALALYEVGGGALTAIGHGIVGTWLGRHNMIHAARRYGMNSYMQGKKSLAESWKELKNEIRR